MIDSHCHLDWLQDQDIGSLPQLFADLPRQGVLGCLCIALRHDTFEAMQQRVGQRHHVWFSAGNHPNEVFDVEPQVCDWVSQAKCNSVIAVGETGLDFYYDNVSKAVQHDRFLQHIDVARRVQKPLIIHCRDAYDAVFDCLSHHPDVPFVMHCFTGDWPQAERFLALGGMISFSGVVTFKNAVANQDAARQVPLDRLLIETDSPYLAPVPRRGKPNQPGYVRYVAEKVATLRDIPVDDLVTATTHNFFNFFGVSPNQATPFSVIHN